MYRRYLTAFVIFLVSFAAGLGLTRLFLKSTPPSGQHPPTIIQNGDNTETNADGETETTRNNVSDRSSLIATDNSAPTNTLIPPPAPVTRRWWQGLGNKRCRVNLGNTTSLRIRQGTLNDGQVINWEEQFAQQTQMGLLQREENHVVLVHGVGVNENQEPIAAHITLSGIGSEVSGIIALSVNDVRVTLYPVDGEKKTP
jgi:hypothetical protein